MMKMATGEGSPLLQGAGTGLDWLLVGMEASGGGTPDLLCSPIILGYMEIYRRKKYVRGATRGPRGWRARPLPRGFMLLPLRGLQVLWTTFVPKITFPKVSFRLGSI